MRYINIQKKRPTSKLLLGRPLITAALVMIYKRESGWATPSASSAPIWGAGQGGETHGDTTGRESGAACI